MDISRLEPLAIKQNQLRIISEHRGVMRKSVQISAEKNPQTGQNSILAEIFGGADLR